MEGKKNQQSADFGRRVTIKGLTIIGMIVLLLIPITLLQCNVQEREQRKNAAVAEICNSWSRAQTFCGPVMTVPFVKQVADNSEKGSFKEVRTLISFTPKTLGVTADIAPESRRYGMYEAILYKSSVRLSGTFAPIEYNESRDGVPDLSDIRISMGVSDMRGLSNRLVMNFAGRDYEAEVGDGGMLAINPSPDILSGTMPFDCSIELRGSDGLYFTPVGQTTTVELKGKWSHPSFKGDFIPEHNVSKETQDFNAKWTVLSYNRNIPDRWEGGIMEVLPPRWNAGFENMDSRYSNESYDRRFGVKLVTGADEYQQNERAVKYALLFVVLTFVVFFFVEVLTHKRIHPIQYMLVAAALVIFYTLLLSISEIIGFPLAYLLSAVATVGLITFYTAHIFKSVRETALLCGILTGLYAYFYFILQMENYTLLVGSVGVFAILGVIMYVSRKVNWYRGGNSSTEKTPA